METELLKMLVERSSYINTYWHIYLLVATALIGVVASDKIKIDKALRIVFVIAFATFAISNLLAILDVIETRNLLVKQIDNELKVIAESLKPNGKCLYVIFHIALDILVLTAIWMLNRQDEKTTDD